MVNSGIKMLPTVVMTYCLLIMWFNSLKAKSQMGILSRKTQIVTIFKHLWRVPFKRPWPFCEWRNWALHMWVDIFTRVHLFWSVSHLSFAIFLTRDFLDKLFVRVSYYFYLLKKKTNILINNSSQNISF